MFDKAVPTDVGSKSRVWRPAATHSIKHCMLAGTYCQPCTVCFNTQDMHEAKNMRCNRQRSFWCQAHKQDHHWMIVHMTMQYDDLSWKKSWKSKQLSSLLTVNTDTEWPHPGTVAQTLTMKKKSERPHVRRTATTPDAKGPECTERLSPWCERGCIMSTLHSLNTEEHTSQRAHSA